MDVLLKRVSSLRTDYEVLHCCIVAADFRPEQMALRFQMQAERHQPKASSKFHGFPSRVSRQKFELGNNQNMGSACWASQESAPCVNALLVQEALAGILNHVVWNEHEVAMINESN